MHKRTIIKLGIFSILVGAIYTFVYEVFNWNLTFSLTINSEASDKNFFRGTLYNEFANRDRKTLKANLLNLWPFSSALNKSSELSGSSTYNKADEAFIWNANERVNILDVPLIRVTSCNCEKLFRGDRAESDRCINVKKKILSDEKQSDNLLKQTTDCITFISERKYIIKPISDEEASFSIAFSIVVYKNVEQVERLIRAIYRPQNIYCIHIDKKSPLHFVQAMISFVQCFPNVFIASRSVDVEWGSFSLLEADLICMQDLWHNKNWKYFINLTGQEFPLKTNLDIVRILRTYNGANDVEGTLKRRNKERIKFIHRGFMQTSKLKNPPSINVTITKGAVHIAVQRGFVDYVLHNENALIFLDWVKDTGVPDETYFSSLNHSPQLNVPGSYKGDPETHPIDKPYLTRFKNWGDYPFNWPCYGKRIRMICVFGIGDLPMLRNQRHLFANKFYLDYEPFAYDCMEELHYNRTRLDISGQRSYDISYYRQLSFVNNHVL